MLVVSSAATAAIPSRLANVASPIYRKGDDDFLSRQDDDRARDALVFYREQYRRETAASGKASAEAGWRLAMADYFVGLRLTPNREEQIKLFAEGRDAGLVAVAQAPNCASCHFWTAIDMALYGDRVGAVKMFFSLNEIRAHLNRVIAIDPSYASGGAYRLLGLISQKLPGILGGDNAEAKRNFERATQAAPDEPLNFLFLAKLQDEELHDRVAAIESLNQGLAVPAPAANRLESIEALKDLHALKLVIDPPEDVAK